MTLCGLVSSRVNKALAYRVEKSCDKTQNYAELVKLYVTLFTDNKNQKQGVVLFMRNFKTMNFSNGNMYAIKYN